MAGAQLTYAQVLEAARRPTRLIRRRANNGDKVMTDLYRSNSARRKEAPSGTAMGELLMPPVTSL
jgi:hypothetical protein